MQALIKTPVFFKAYFEYLGQYDKSIEAYEALENQYKKQYGVRRYKNYEVFKVAKSRYLKQMRHDGQRRKK